MLRYRAEQILCQDQLCEFVGQCSIPAVVCKLQLLRRLTFKREFLVPFIPTKHILLLFPTRNPLKGLTVEKETVDFISTYLSWLKEMSEKTFKIQEFLVCTLSGSSAIVIECDEVLAAIAVHSVSEEEEAPSNGNRRVLSVPCDKSNISDTDLYSNYYIIPTCTVCAERLETTLTGYTSRMCRCVSDKRCTCFTGDSSCIVCQTAIRMQKEGNEIHCDECQLSGDPWICLVCGFVGCSRYQAQHAREHYLKDKHFFSMSLLTQQIWDYNSDAFVHRVMMSFDSATGVIHRVQYPDRDNLLTSLDNDVEEEDFVEEKAKKKRINAKYDSKLETSNKEPALMIKNELDMRRARYESELRHLKKQQQGCSHMDGQCVDGLLKEYNTMDIEKTHRANRQRGVSLFFENENLRKKLQMFKEEEEMLEQTQRSLDNELRETVRQFAMEDHNLTDAILNLQESIRDIELNLSMQKKLAKELEGDGCEYLCVMGNADDKSKGNKGNRRRKS